MTAEPTAEPVLPTRLAEKSVSVVPAISAVIPCRNEKDHIESCIRSLLAQEPPLSQPQPGEPHEPAGIEVLIADGMSDDGTRDILHRLAAEDSRLRILDNPRQTTPCGMNVGIQAARGRVIAIMGAHNRYAPDYLRRGVEVLAETAADNVGGAMECEAETYLQHAIAAAHHSPFAVGGARWHDPDYEGPADTVFGGVYRKETFERLGLFDEELVRNQDDEFNLRLSRAGGHIWQSPRIKSWYHPRASLRAVWNQYQQYGYWKVRVIQKHRLPASVRHLVPGGFVFALLSLPLMAVWWPLAAWGWIGLLGLYTLGTGLASILCAAQQSRHARRARQARYGWTLLPVLPLVFACYQLGYGVGFLRGVWDFVLLRRGPRRASTQLTRSSMS